jgi:hypothetical protein
MHRFYAHGTKRILFDDHGMKKRARCRICRQFWITESTGTQMLLYDFYLYHMRRLRQAIFHNEAGRIAATLTFLATRLNLQPVTI